MEAYQRALAMDSMQSWVHINLGVGYDGLARFEEAAAHFEKSFAMDSAGTTNWRGDVNRISGFVLVKTGDKARARERFELLLSGDEHSRANGLRSLALLEMYSGRHTAAVGLLEEAISLNQQVDAPLSEYRNRMYLAQAYRSKGMGVQLAEQLAVGQRLAREGGWGANWTIYQALHLVSAGDLQRAREWLNSWIQDGVAEGDLRWIVEYVRGEIALAEGNPADAVAALERADRSHRMGHGLIMEALGRAYQTNGRLEQSVAAFREAIKLKQLGWEPQESWVLAHYRLGVVLQEMGETEQARTYLDRFLELWGSGDDDLQGVADARSRLDGRG